MRLLRWNEAGDSGRAACQSQRRGHGALGARISSTIRKADFQVRKVGYEPESSTPEVPLLEAVCPEGNKDLPRDCAACARTKL